MIICGFPGVGKSRMAKEYVGVVDLESTPFEKDWSRYVKVAEHMDNNGYTVLLSTHKEVLEMLSMEGIVHTVVIPSVKDQEEYLRRYKNRGNGEEFIEKIMANWRTWIRDIVVSSDVFRTIIVMSEGAYISNVVNVTSGLEERE